MDFKKLTDEELHDVKMEGQPGSNYWEWATAEQQRRERLRDGVSRRPHSSEVPGIELVERKLRSIHRNLTIVSAEYVPGRMIYSLILAGNGREGVVEFSKEFLDDLRDNTSARSSEYSMQLDDRLEATLRQAIARHEPGGSVSSSTKAKVSEASDSFEYDVAISFAGEQRHEAEGIAQCLREKNVKVFYDVYEQSNLWGKDLYAHLADVYQNKARFCLMLVSADYAAKVWTNHERKSAQARALSEKQEYILPVRFDETPIPGLPDTVGYLRFNDYGVHGICELLVKKLSGRPNYAGMPATKQIIVSDPEEYRLQRKALPITEILQKIYSKPYWLIWIRPTEFKPARFRNLDQCKRFMQSSSVRVPQLIPYPSVSARGVFETGDDWIANEFEGPHELERWNLFRSGQFVHYRAVDNTQYSEHLHALEILDKATQVFEFAARLNKERALSENARITIDLFGIDSLSLTWPADQGHTNQVPSDCWSQDKHINVVRGLATVELDKQKRQMALQVVLEIYAQFGWSEPPNEKIAATQKDRFSYID